METSRRILLLRRLGVAVVVLTFSVMVLGSWVKATGSGLACPDWPACYGQWAPPFPSKETGGMDPDAWDTADAYTQAQVLYEYGHRLAVTLLAPVLVAFAWISLRGLELHPAMRYLPGSAGVVLVLQILVGGATVLQGNPAAVTTLHLATATLFFFLVTMATTIAFTRPLAVQPPAAPQQTTVYPGEDHA